MNTLIKIFYAGALTALLILLVAFGIRTFYEPPEGPEIESSFPVKGVVAPCPALSGPSPSAEEQQKFEECLRLQEEASRQSFEEYEARRQPYLDERADYHRNVFLIVGLLGIASVVGGVALHSRMDALRLGLVGGGLGLIIYGVAQGGEDLDDMGAASIFILAIIGIAALLASGYLWMGGKAAPAGGNGEGLRRD